MASKGNSISRTIVKAMGVFGSIQVFNILVSIARTKLIALWIGPAGIGLFAIFNSAIDMISNITNLGMRTSTPRDISIAASQNDATRLARVCTVVRRWSWILGLLGAIVIAGASPLLSKMSFGDSDHIWGFIILSVALLANALTNCEFSILQGTSLLKKLAKSSLYGAILGLILSIPLFYYLGENSIVPSILCYSLSVLFFSHMLRNKEAGRNAGVITAKETYQIGKDFLKLGIFITLTDVVSQISNYAFISYLNNVSNTDTVGYYQAGYTLIAKYTGLILSALCVEYYPRLSKVAHSNIKLNLFVSQEINIALMVLTPFISAFILFRKIILSILYTPDFYVIETFISVGIIGMVFRALSWSMAFVILAKGKGKIFFITETSSTLIFLLLYIPAYHLFGINGFGIAFLVWYLLYALIISYVYYRIFHLSLKPSCFKWLIWALAATSATLLAMETGNIVVAVAILACTLIFSASQFKKMMFRRK